MTLDHELEEITEQARNLLKAKPDELVGIRYTLRMAIEGARLSGASEDQIEYALALASNT